MAVWHFDYHIIEEFWTNEQYFAMIKCMNKRLLREARAMKKGSRGNIGSSSSSSPRKGVTTTRQTFSLNEMFSGKGVKPVVN